ncbi:MAG: hypothetical protein H7256_09625 [Bdellovibrio sp.]|nr:hypothetical protein [Bdellovibrio sp.]
MHWLNVKMFSKKYLSTLLFILSLPFFSYAFDGKFEKRQFGSHKISLSQNFETGLGKLSIKNGNKKVFEESEIDNHYSFGNSFEPNSNDGPDLYSGRDITGNKLPNLIISNWTGGAHCCHFVHIFELGKKVKKLVTVQAMSSSVRFVDLDNDGFPEIEFWDGSIDYQFACFADSPSGRVVLKFKKDHYEVATGLMNKPAPTQQKIRVLKEAITLAFEKKDTPDLPYDFLNTVMELSYTGHFNLALKLADEVWPSGKPGLAKFKNEFSEALHESIYWKNYN